jgi:hypothetical protein
MVLALCPPEHDAVSIPMAAARTARFLIKPSLLGYILTAGKRTGPYTKSGRRPRQGVRTLALEDILRFAIVPNG